MRLYPEKLPAHLQQQLLPIYLVCGDETLLVQDCCDLIRKRAREAGCNEREIFEAGATGFKWQEILHNAASMSLFSERKLIEIRLSSGKPGKEGSKILCEYLENQNPDDVLLLVFGKVDKATTNSKWYKAIDSAGATIQVWPVDAKNLPRWLQQRVHNAGMEIEKEALQLLCERIEGNLLAAVQEVEKLKLLAVNGQITPATITAAVASSARYNAFSMADAALRGNARDALRMLHGLRADGQEPPVVLWAPLRDIRTLYAASADCANGQSAERALGNHGVWKNRMPQLRAALSRHSEASLAELLQFATEVDGSIKGYAGGSAWDKLEQLILALSSARRSEVNSG